MEGAAGSTALSAAEATTRPLSHGKAMGESAAEGLVQGAFAGAAIVAAVGETVWHEVTVHQLREEMCHCRIRQPKHGAP